MKNTIKLVLVAVLFCSTVIADDGSMGAGKTCTGNCLIENGPILTEQNTNESDDSTAIITFVREYLFSIFG